MVSMESMMTTTVDRVGGPIRPAAPGGEKAWRGASAMSPCVRLPIGRLFVRLALSQANREPDDEQSEGNRGEHRQPPDEVGVTVRSPIWIVHTELERDAVVEHKAERDYAARECRERRPVVSAQRNGKTCDEREHDPE